MKEVKVLADVLLIIAWLIIVAFELPTNGWLVFISILFWLFSDYSKLK